MDRRHQVFVSSTFKDLEEERQEIIYALLELDCMPAGMELFPATDADAWALITSVIDDSDYYLLVIGGRYGSTGPDGISFTEKEYDYAVANNKPVMAFLHSAPGTISAAKTEESMEGKAKLAAFRAKVEANKHVKFWSNAAELGGVVSRSLVKLRRQFPSDGWVPGRYAMTEAAVLELEQLRGRVKELEAELVIVKNLSKVQERVTDLAQGDDTSVFLVVYRFKEKSENGGENHKTVEIPVSWNDILRYVGPSLMGECDDETLIEKMNLLFWHKAPKDVENKTEYSLTVLPHVTVDKIKTQLRALGYLVPGIKRRAVADKKVYWALTTAGEEALFRATAQRKPELHESPA